MHDRLHAGGQDQCQRGGPSSLRQADHHQDRPGRPRAVQRGPHPGRRGVQRAEDHRLQRPRSGHPWHSRDSLSGRLIPFLCCLRFTRCAQLILPA